MSEPVWVPLGTAGTPKAVYPIDFRNPQVASNAGNCYPLVSSLTGWEEWAWGFSATATGYVFGVFRLPENVPNPATATMKFDLASAGAGNAVIFATLKGIADGETLNIASWDWSSQVTVPLVARTRKIHAVAGVTIPAILAPGDFCVAAFARLGADAADTLASPLELLYGALVID
jgi:hypothetical protein